MKARPPADHSMRQLRWGWWSLGVFLTLGIFLEALHGLKSGWYLDVGNDMRRLMFTLAHAHGTLLALVNIGAGLTARCVHAGVLGRGASGALLGAGLLLPLGFLLGGVVIHEGDPGLGIILVPVGAVLLLFGVVRGATSLTEFAGDEPKK